MDNTRAYDSERPPVAGPALTASCFFLAGIVAGSVFPVPPYLAALFVAAGTAALLLLLNRRLSGDLAAAAALAAAGIFVVAVQSELTGRFLPPPDMIGSTVTAEGRVTEAPRFGYGSTRFPLRVRAITDETGVRSVSGTVMCTLGGRTVDIPEGALVRVSGVLRRSRRPVESPGALRRRLDRRYRYVIISRGTDPLPGIVPGTGPGIFTALQKRLSDALERHSFGGRAAVLKTMTIGDTTDLDPETRGLFVRSGIAHVLAVSGLHLGIVAAFLHLLLRPLPISMKARNLAVAVAAVVYAGICGFRPPVVRAAILCLMLMGAMSFRRMKNPENSLFVALLVVAALQPAAVFGPSLELSFAAVWGIVTFFPTVSRYIRTHFTFRWPLTRVLEFFAVSCIAYLMTAPISAAHFGTLPLYGILSGFFAVPLTVAVVVLGVATLVLSLAGTIAALPAAAAASLAGACLGLLEKLASFTSGLPYALVAVERMPPFLPFVFFAWLFALSRFRAGPRFARAVAYIPLAYLLLATWLPLAAETSLFGGTARVVFFDVGQGDSALVYAGDESAVLIDAGPRFEDYDAGRVIVAPSLLNLGVDRLGCIVLSHTHIDHAGGLESVLEHIETERIVCRESIADSLRGLYGDIVVGVAAGDSLALPRLGMLVLSPNRGEAIGSAGGSPENNVSLVVRITAGGRNVLFTGDIERSAQAALAAWGGALAADILKAPHHGAEGLSRAFVEAVAPELAVVSCGAGNRFGHPSESTVELLGTEGGRVMRTDRDGTVVVTLPELVVEAD